MRIDIYRDKNKTNQAWKEIGEEFGLPDGDTSLTLGAVLAFATGLKRIPAVGFPIQPRLEFLHEEDGPALFPTINTCSLVLWLLVYPVYHGFNQAMEEGITSCGSTFGVA
ncbi:unnamed protein product [Arctogadus glacialis]